MCISVVKWHDGPEALIACSVPDVELNLLSVFGFDFLLLVGAGESGFMGFLEHTFLVPHGDGGFSDSSIATEYQLDGLFGVVFGEDFGFLSLLLFFLTREKTHFYFLIKLFINLKL